MKAHLISEHHTSIEQEVSTDQIFRKSGKTEDEKIAGFYRRHHLFHSGFALHYILDDFLRSNPPLFSLGRDLLEDQVGLDIAGY